MPRVKMIQAEKSSSESNQFPKCQCSRPSIASESKPCRRWFGNDRANDHRRPAGIPSSTGSNDKRTVASRSSTTNFRKEIFDDFRTLDDHQRRGASRSIGVGDAIPAEKEERTTTTPSGTKIPDGVPTAMKRIRRKSLEFCLRHRCHERCAREARRWVPSNNNNRLAEPPAGSSCSKSDE